MRRNYVIAISLITALVGSRYYFGLTMLEGHYIQLYGMISLVISVLLGSSCLRYLPKLFSRRLDFYALGILCIIQFIPIFYFSGYALEEQLMIIVELIIPLVMVLLSGVTVIYLILIKCREIISVHKRSVKKHSKPIQSKKKRLTFKMKG